MDETIRTAAISPLRQRLINDMNVRRFSRATQHGYIRDVGRFATFLGRSPDTATVDDVRRFQIELRDAGVSAPTMNSIVSALRFFFTHTIDRPDLACKLIRTGHPRALPMVLSRDEVARLLNATTCLKHQAALSVAYGAGLCVAEVAMQVSDIDSERMLLRVERGNGGRYRNAILPADLLTLLREWWKVGRQQGVMHAQGWLFPGQQTTKPISTRHLHRIVVEAAPAAESPARKSRLRRSRQGTFGRVRFGSGAAVPVSFRGSLRNASSASHSLLIAVRKFRRETLSRDHCQLALGHVTAFAGRAALRVAKLATLNGHPLGRVLVGAS